MLSVLSSVLLLLPLLLLLLMMEEHWISIAQACSGRMEMMEGLGGGRPGRPMPSFLRAGNLSNGCSGCCTEYTIHDLEAEEEEDEDEDEASENDGSDWMLV